MYSRRNMIKAATKLSAITILLVFPHVFAYGNNLEANLLDCRAIILDAQRLRCLDDAIAGLQITEPSGEEAKQNHPKQVNTSTQLGEKYVQYKHDDDSDKNQEHSFSLVNAYQNRKKQWVFELDNGQLWQQNEARYLPSPQVFPVKVTISEGMFGAYNLKSEYLSKTVKVKRIH